MRRLLTLGSRLMAGLLAVAVTLSASGAMSRGPHCARHHAGMEAMAGMPAVAHADGAQAAITGHDSGMPGDCPHCPAQQCAVATPCSAAGQAGTPRAEQSLTAIVIRRTVVAAPDDRPLSVSVQPPTPPPVSILA